jgi:hypothetical protein
MPASPRLNSTYGSIKSAGEFQQQNQFRITFDEFGATLGRFESFQNLNGGKQGVGFPRQAVPVLLFR